MQRTITTITVSAMTAQKDDKGNFSPDFVDFVAIADTEKAAKKEFQKSGIAGVIIGYSEPKTAKYILDDYEFLKLATAETVE